VGATLVVECPYCKANLQWQRQEGRLHGLQVHWATVHPDVDWKYALEGVENLYRPL
jgi:hypothetical protein